MCVWVCVQSFKHDCMDITHVAAVCPLLPALSCVCDQWRKEMQQQLEEEEEERRKELVKKQKEEEELQRQKEENKARKLQANRPARKKSASVSEPKD